jgi:hypothetical protein
VRSAGVVVLPPLFDDNLRFLQAVEDFSVQAFIPELTVKTLVIAVLPGTAGFDE